MKKVFYLVAVATFVFFSCKKEVVSPVESQNSFTLQASIEQLASPSKADINASNQLVWATDDKVGVFVDDGGWTDKNQPFHVETGGSTTGKLIWDYGTFDNENATVAFFPWQGLGTDKNNVSGGAVYFKLPQSYAAYTSGKMLTPLVSQVTRTGNAINNLPAGSHSIGMKVDGKQISGDFHVTPNNASPAALELDGTEETAKNEVWLDYDPANAERAFTFLFPVPELTTPKLSFKIYDKNNVLVWSKNLKAQQNSLGRSDVLEMPAIDITPYADFNQIHPSWTVCGTANGTNWDTDFPMITDGTNTFCIAKGLVFADGGAFKVRAWGGSSWYPSDNVVVPSAGNYDIVLILDGSNWPTSVVAVPTGECPYPSVNGLSKGNNLHDPKALDGTFGTYFE